MKQQGRRPGFHSFVNDMTSLLNQIIVFKYSMSISLIFLCYLQSNGYFIKVFFITFLRLSDQDTKTKPHFVVSVSFCVNTCITADFKLPM